MNSEKLLIVVDMQNDFIDGALGTPEAVNIVENVCNRIKNFDGEVVFTLDTHGDDYLNTREGKNLPVKHCVKGTEGFKLNRKIKALSEGCRIFEKPTFGSLELAQYVKNGEYKSIELIGLCTDICVISNAILVKSALPESDVTVDSACCAGVTPDSHSNALNAMRMCQIEIK